MEKREFFGIGASLLIFDKHKNVLLLFRSKDCKYNPNSWDVPGGKLKKNESIHDGLSRETYEEIGIKIKEIALISYRMVKKPEISNRVLNLIFYTIVDKISIKLSDEHSKFEWFLYDEIPNSLDQKLSNAINEVNNML